MPLANCDLAQPALKSPTFIIIGAAKAATTSLAQALDSHPEVFMTKPKEPKFFGRYYTKGRHWYSSLFDKGSSFPIKGEASTMYSSRMKNFKRTPELIKDYCPEVKIIYVVRHPLDRIVSHWRHYANSPKLPPLDSLLNSSKFSRLIIGSSLYWYQINRYRACFPDSQFLCVLYEELVSQPLLVLDQILGYVGASEIANQLLPNGQLPWVNQAGTNSRPMVPKPTWSSSAKSRVIEIIRPDAQHTLQYLDKSFNTWEF